MFNSVPYYPAASFYRAMADFPVVLSGYIGDLVFGSYDFSDTDLHRLESDPAYLMQRVHKTADLIPPEAVRSLLHNEDCDPLLTEQSISAIEADDPEERFARWLWEDHLLNRTNFAVELFRSRTYYLAPYVHADVMNTAYRIPREQRRKERAFMDSLKENYPMLWRYPTKRNYGFSLAANSSPRVFAARAFRKALSKIDNSLGGRTGRIFYHHPATNYTHARELMQDTHRENVLAALSRLRGKAAFNSDNMNALIRRYKKRQTISRYLLQGLLTVDCWYQHYDV
jgi:hypothetical protein